MTIPHRDIGIQAGQALLARLNEQPWQQAGSLPATLCRRDSC
jgi:DNA-binding LacI/PurR family transcriptional regulator